MKIVVGVLGVIGRILLCTVFLAAAMGYPVVHRFAACSPGRRGAQFRLCSLNLSVPQILAWANAHFRKTGKWPNRRSGAIEAVPRGKWISVDFALRNGQPWPAQWFIAHSASCPAPWRPELRGPSPIDGPADSRLGRRPS